MLFIFFYRLAQSVAVKQKILIYWEGTGIFCYFRFIIFIFFVSAVLLLCRSVLSLSCRTYQLHIQQIKKAISTPPGVCTYVRHDIVTLDIIKPLVWNCNNR